MQNANFVALGSMYTTNKNLKENYSWARCTQSMSWPAAKAPVKQTSRNCYMKRVRSSLESEQLQAILEDVQKIKSV